MKQRYITVVVITFTFLLVFKATAQDNKPIVITSKDGGNKKVLEFKDTLTGRVTKTFDIAENNPFNKLNYPIVHTQRNGAKVYNVSKVDKSLIYGNSLPDARVQTVELETASVDQVVNVQENHAIISYKLIFTAKEGGITAVKNKTLILNVQGKTVGELPENSRGCDMPVVTDDGRYLACFYGGINAEGSISSVEPLGILIYDVNNNSTIVDLSSSSGYDLYRPIAFGNVIVVEVRNRHGSHTFHAYLPKERKLFKKTYSKQEIVKLTDINEKGVIFTNPDGSKSTDLFTRDFSSDSIW